MKKSLSIIVAILILGGIYFVLYDGNHDLSDSEEFIKKDMAEFHSTYGKVGVPGNVTYLTTPIDLNDDGNSEMVIYDVRIDGIFMGGASGNEQYIIYGKVNSRWKQVGELGGNQYTLLSEKTDGYRNIRTRWHMSATSYYEDTYQWSLSEQKYTRANSKLIDVTR